MPNTKLQMLLRGQNLVGYRNYADDVVDAFVTKAADVGIDIFRVFDALNDERNFLTSFKAIKKNKKHIQGAISYSLTLKEKKLGGPIFNIDYYIKKAKIIEDMGADSLCIKDMSGIISPYDAYTLIAALKANIKIPIHLHTHYTSGMASMSMLKAIEAGVDGIDTCLAPFSHRSSHPAIEPFVVTLKDTPHQLNFDLRAIAEIDDYLESIIPKYISFADTTRFSVIDIGVLMHQIPGGMISNLVSQLRQVKALAQVERCFEEVPRTRMELGFPPLVTPQARL